MTYTFKLSRRLAVSRYSCMSVLLMLTMACTDAELPTAADEPPSITERHPDLRIFPDSVYAEVNQRIPLRAPSGWTELMEWSSTGGTISAEGVFAAASTGSYKVVGKARGRHKGDTTIVIVIDSTPNIVAVVLSPDTTAMQPLQAIQFTARGETADGSLSTIGTVWTADGGSIDAAGRYVAGNAEGHFHVIATNVAGTLADTAVVAVESVPVENTVHTLELTPGTVTLAANGSQQFAAQARYTDGTSAKAVARFAATGGTISSSGLFTAGPTPGTYRVVATDSSGAADTAAVVVEASPTGPVIYPGSSIQAAVDANPAGTAFLLKSGVHRMQQVRPKAGNSFTGETGTILSGARPLTGFARSGTAWVVEGQTQQGISTEPIHCETGFEGCQWPEDLFIDDQLKLRVTSLSAVAPGKWYFDYAGDKIYIGDDPTGRRVETSVSPYAFGGAASNVTLRRLIVEKYATPAQAGAIQGDDADGWVVEDVEVRQNHAIGIRIGDGWQVRGCKVHHNGQLGLSKGGTGSLVEGCDIHTNKTVPFKMGFAGGALKFWKSNGLVFRNNQVHDNLGNGIWFDIDNINYRVYDNVVYNNAGQGIFIEISYGGKIYNNRVYGNGFGRSSSWLFGAGILIAASPDVEVYGNEVVNNANGITAIQQDRGTGAYGPHEINNLYVHDNVIAMSDGKTGLAQSVGDASYYTSRNNRWVRNTYRLGSKTAYFAWNGAMLTESQWRQYGQDTDGTFIR